MEISRSKWDNFIKCPLCFYLKEKHNIDPPSTPRFTINMRVDNLLKEEFDELRAKGEPLVEFGRILEENVRTYSGPVDIERLKIQLLDDKGNLVNLHDNDWSFSLVVEQLV